MNEKYPLALPQGTILAGQYIIEEVLGQGGFGITYRAADHKNKSKVAVKEFFPDTLAARTSPTAVSAFTGPKGDDFAYGKSCFIEEVQTLAKFIGNENIVRIHSYFEENGTAYFVMDYIEGISFADYIRHYGGRISFEKSVNVLVPVMDALSAVHSQGIIHRDVTPDNIFITNEGIVKLIDFGAARYSLGDKSQSLDIVLKHGYAPKEQYMRHGKQGPYTDIYSLGACFYYALTGKLPPDSIDRLDEDTIVPIRELGIDIPAASDAAIMKALSVRAEDRFRSMEDFKLALFGRAPAEPSPAPVKQRYFTPPEEDATYPDDKIKPKRSPVLYIAIACTALLLIIILFILGKMLFQTKDSPEDNNTVAGREEISESAADEEYDEQERESTETTDITDSETDTSDDTDTAFDTKGQAQIGFGGYTLTDEQMESTGLDGGVYVAEISEGKGAEAAGMKPGDIITEVNGRNILSMEVLKEELSNYQVGDTVFVVVRRPTSEGHTEMQLNITLSAKEEV